MPLTVTDHHGRNLHVGSAECNGPVPWVVGVSSYVQTDLDTLDIEDLRSVLLTPAQAERVAAKLLHSAAVARYMAGDGPRPTTGPRGIEKLSAVLAQRLREVA